MKTNNLFEELVKYFETTPKEQILKEWAETEEFDKIGLTVDDFFKQSQYSFNMNLDELQCLKPILDNNLSPEFTSGFFLTKKQNYNATSSIFN